MGSRQEGPIFSPQSKSCCSFFLLQASVFPFGMGGRRRGGGLAGPGDEAERGQGKKASPGGEAKERRRREENLSFLPSRESRLPPAPAPILPALPPSLLDLLPLLSSATADTLSGSQRRMAPPIAVGSSSPLPSFLSASAVPSLLPPLPHQARRNRVKIFQLMVNPRRLTTSVRIQRATLCLCTPSHQKPNSTV